MREEEGKRREGGREVMVSIISQHFCSVVGMCVRIRTRIQVLSQNIKCSAYCALPTK